MLPHPHTAVILMEFEYQERLRDAARERLAASAQRSAPSRRAWAKTALPISASWLIQRLLPRPGLPRVRIAPPVA